MKHHLRDKVGLALLAIGCLLTAAAAAEAPNLSSLCLNPPTLTAVVPPDTPINDQASINCFAWQEFIGLNWLAAGGAASTFGRPGDFSPVAWQEFVDTPNLRAFLNGVDGAEPPAAGDKLPAPNTCPADETATLTLLQTSKLTNQVFEEGRPSWLADRDANPVLYQILINEDEYEYIRSHGLTAADSQYARLALGNHVNMPRGVIGGDVGSIEIKAAWLALPPRAEGEARWRDRYKLARARVYDEGDGDCEVRTVALVGLHVVHKTASNPQWIWATFEHVDNAPDVDAVADGPPIGDRYRFWSDDCVERPVPAACSALSVGECGPMSPPVAMTSCAPNQTPAYCLDLFNEECPPYPIQTARIFPVADSGDNLVRRTNQAVQKLIGSVAGPDSVWQHYQLVGTVWSGAPVDSALPGSTPPQTPLSIAGMRPSLTTMPLANATMETFVQNSTCLECHRSAHITMPGNAISHAFASDYSFVLQGLQERHSR